MMRILLYIFGLGLWVLGAVYAASSDLVIMSEFTLGLMLVVWGAVFLFVSLRNVQVGNCGAHAGDSGMNVQTYALGFRVYRSKIKLTNNSQNNERLNSVIWMHISSLGKACGFIYASGFLAGKYIRVLMRVFRQARRI